MENTINNIDIIQPLITINELINILASNNINEDIYKKIFLIDSVVKVQDHKFPLYFHSNDIAEKIKNYSDTINFIYIARCGKSFNAHILAEKVLNSGNIFLGEIKHIETIYPHDFNKIINHPLFIPIKDSEKSLSCILEKSFGIEPKKFFTIAVTGTNGKTSVTQITANLLNEITHENILKIGTLGAQIANITLPVSHVTTPDYPSFLSILSTAQKNYDCKKIILEYTSHGLKEKRLGKWIVDIAIFTNLTQDHLDYHKTMQEYRAAKELLFNTCLSEKGTAVININNNEWISFVQAAKGNNKNLIIVGNKNLHSEINAKFRQKFKSITYVHIDNPIANLKGINGEIIIRNQDLGITDQQNFSCPLIGEFQFENILCAAGVGISLKFPLEKICLALQKIQNIAGRLERIPSSSQKLIPTILVDYAHTPDALEKAILTCKKTLVSPGKLITVFGCGGDRDATKRPLMGDIAFKHSDIAIVTSDNPRTENPNKIIDDIFHGIRVNENRMRETDRKKAIEKAILLASKNDVILVAGKGHEDYQIIGSTKYPFSDADVIKSILEKI